MAVMRSSTFDWVRAGLRASEVSIVWTCLAGTAAIALGATQGSLALAAFGAIGLLDAAGSCSLVIHFRSALHHRSISHRLERVSLGIVTIGMAVVGIATLAGSGLRLVAGTGGHSTILGVILAAASVVVLSFLATRKRTIAHRIPSDALLADSWLSATGAALAFVTLLGTGTTAAFHWSWLDPGAAIAVACVAIAMSVVLGRGVTRLERSPSSDLAPE
jgi:divalent metal cation (Fe/Co/Zn/Cd) transporter